jgi:hypothetical protein
MRRREFITAIAGAAAGRPLRARAQQAEGMRRVGVLTVTDEKDPEGQARVAALRRGLERLGWLQGRNVQIDYRTSPNPEQRRAYAMELVASNPDVIVAGATAALAPLQQATRTIPIVFAQVSDPIGTGFVPNLAHPGGNITGFALYDQAIGVKWLELVKQLAPHTTRVVIIYDPATPSSKGYLAAMKTGASSLDEHVDLVAVHGAGRGWKDVIVHLPHDGVATNNITGKRYIDHRTEASFECGTPIKNTGAGAAMMRIEAARRVFARCWFNESTTEAGRDALGYYHERQDEKRSIGLGPEHDWSSHAADAFGYMAIAYEEPPVKSAAIRRPAPPRMGTHWSD